MEFGMDKIYFLLIVGVGIAAVLLLIWSAEKKHKAKLKARKKKLQRKANLHYRHEPPHLRSVHGHTARTRAHGTGAWESRNQRAQEEMRDGKSIAARRLYSDDEKSDGDLAMGAVDYVPEDHSRTIQKRR
jgi:hypothetical protein